MSEELKDGQEIGRILREQKEAREGLIISTRERADYLKALRKALVQHEREVIEALKADLGKTDFEILGSEIGLVLQEISYVLRHMPRWIRGKKKRLPISHWPASARVKPEPYGLVLIICPWNYPIQLAFIPLVAAIAAGNSAHIKLSEKSPAINKVIHKLVKEVFPSWLVSVSEIDAHMVRSQILDVVAFDKIFFTGGSVGGKAIAEYAASRLTPFCLELGGKSPAIVDETADIKTAARRLVWAKMLNAGQSCITPDFVLVIESQKEALLTEMVKEYERIWAEYDDKKEAMGHIVDAGKWEQLQTMKNNGTLYYSGDSEKSSNWFHPTILTDVNWNDQVMKEEIFGPILPVLTYTDETDLFEQIKRNTKPLAFYLFSRNKVLEQKIVTLIPFGAGGLNHALMQIASPKLPHGGVGPSGTGRSHGYYGFMEFSHLKTWHKTAIWPDIPLRYAPYSEKKLNLLKRILR